MRRIFLKLFLVSSFFLIAFPVTAEISVLAEGRGIFNVPIQGDESKKVLGALDMSFGGGGKIELRPFPVLGIFASADYVSQRAEFISPYNILSADIGGRSPLAVSGQADRRREPVCGSLHGFTFGRKGKVSVFRN